jgi:hypothetical protein
MIDLVEAGVALGLVAGFFVLPLIGAAITEWRNDK